MTRSPGTLVLAAALALAGCRSTDLGAATAEMVESRLFLGSNIAGQPGVTEKDWQQFLAEVVTPRFPDGLTVLPASGQWRSSATSPIEREQSRILLLLHDGDPTAETALDTISAAYKDRFDQQGVLRIDRRVWVTFE